MSDWREKRLRQVLPTVSRETVERLFGFEDLFRKWSKAINLASPTTLDELWERHIIDSAQLYTLIPLPRNGWISAPAAGFPVLYLPFFLKRQVMVRSISLKAMARRQLFCAQL